MSDGIDWGPEAEKYANGQMSLLGEVLSLTKAERRLVRQLFVSAFIEGAKQAMEHAHEIMTR